ncbi:MAG: 1-acyl-sn-glycerol-3-phosphate acyltransferase [Candidatus Pelagibacter sp. TMED272]|nr:1-acyl-sn-glycerol-3-phosphate acyltransferase [Pelagibacteraceae bacterium]RPG93680.1 MAG: 1-acyl-sn-glycerol-3-phosphate acyltransferase [Candidatus Pelagibacter sp. TMED272]|tara:strand:+ start:7683 stop:8390 length:708 start_codon:yes stop_codon:yes gene_type:complete
MQFIRSLIFNICLYSGLIIIFILAIPTLVLPDKCTIFFGRLSAKYMVLALKLVMNTKVIFHGEENLKKVDRFFVASAHQSMFETFALQIPLDGPIFILKKELLSIPLFGLYLRKIGSVAIIRETTTKENLNFFDKIKKRIEESKRPLLIFPQGTRVKLDEQAPFKKGVGRIYKALNLPCIPVALNSGKIWPKNSFMKFAGDIHISFLEPIMPGKDNEEFTKEIENKIYTEIKKYY